MMKLINSYAPLKRGVLYFSMCICTWGFYSCSDDYDDTWIKETTEDLKGRVAALEEWQKSVNTDIQSLQNLVSALEQNDFVTGVTALSDGTGYVISFKKSGDITIKHGKKGEQGDKGEDGKGVITPVISVKKDTNGKYYWTINGEWLLDGKNKMPVTGDKGDKGDTGDKGDKGADAIAPQVRINTGTNEWEVSTDGGTTWALTGVKATGDSMFESVDNSNPYYLVLTLSSDGETIILPKVVADKNTVHVATAGGLQQALQNAGIDAATATKLTIIGTLGNTDFTYLKDNCTSLNRLDLSGLDITVLPERALQGMPFEAVVLPDGLKEIKNLAFYSCALLRTLEIPENVETLGRWIVEECNYLETVTLHNGLKTLSASTFYGCGITSIHIPATVTEIPDWCFENCKNLGAVYLHDGITFIGEGAFFECSALKSFTAPKSVTQIPDAAFNECKNLQFVKLHDNITYIGIRAFYNCIFLAEELVLPKNLTEIGAEAFMRCSGIIRVDMENCSNLITLPFGMFAGCENLIQVIYFPPNLQNIKGNALAQTSISQVSLPASMKTIENDAFSSCNDLTVFTCKATTAPTLSGSPFPASFKGSCQLHYPAGSDYSSWKSFFSKVVEI